MRNPQRKTILTAALALLLLGISAGVGPGRHHCHIDAPPPVSDSGHSAAPDTPHADAFAGFCEACLLTAQLSSLGLSVAPGLLPPPSAAADPAEPPLPVAGITLPAPSSRAPPLA
jgi:hypothetical protein